MIQRAGTKKHRKFVVAAAERQRKSVRRAQVRVGNRVYVNFNNRIYPGVVTEKGAEGRVLVKYTAFSGQYQEYIKGDWRSYLVCY